MIILIDRRTEKADYCKS